MSSRQKLFEILNRKKNEENAESGRTSVISSSSSVSYFLRTFEPSTLLQEIIEFLKKIR